MCGQRELSSLDNRQVYSDYCGMVRTRVVILLSPSPQCSIRDRSNFPTVSHRKTPTYIVLSF